MAETKEEVALKLSSERWLTTQSELRLRISVSETPSRVFCQPYDCTQEFSSESMNVMDLGDKVHFVDLSTEESNFAAQPSNGVLCSENSYLVYRMQTAQADSLGVNVTIYTHDTNAGPDDLHPYLGHFKVLPTMITQASTGTLELTIEDSKGKAADVQAEKKATVDYVYVKPSPALQNTADTCSARWNFSRGPVDMGHRGMGKCRSTKVAPFVIENTVKSFNDTAKCGSDFTEFDVQLSKDDIPVVFHDFLCRVHKDKSEESDSDSTHSDVPVQELTYSELRETKVGFAIETGTTEDVVASDGASEDDEVKIFPTLAQVFKQVEPSLGFNIEIKFPTLLKNGEMEDGLTSFMDMNKYLDIILATVFECCDEREILLSCFNPDVCTMLKLKQNRFPVLFLTQGEAPRYEAFFDLRTRDISVAFRFAAAERFVGVNPISEYILKDLSLVKQARDLGLFVLCWGSENSDSAIIDTLKKGGVQAVCYDRINEFIDKDKVKDSNDQ